MKAASFSLSARVCFDSSAEKRVRDGRGRCGTGTTYPGFRLLRGIPCQPSAPRTRRCTSRGDTGWTDGRPGRPVNLTPEDRLTCWLGSRGRGRLTATPVLSFRKNRPGIRPLADARMLLRRGGGFRPPDCKNVIIILSSPFANVSGEGPAVRAHVPAPWPCCPAALPPTCKLFQVMIFPSITPI